jgi:hypothetical protein
MYLPIVEDIRILKEEYRNLQPAGFVELQVIEAEFK